MMNKSESYSTLDVLTRGIFKNPLKSIRLLKGSLTLQITTQKKARNYLNLKLEFTDGVSTYAVLCDVFQCSKQMLAYELHCNDRVQIRHTDGPLSRGLIDNILFGLLRQMSDLNEQENVA